MKKFSLYFGFCLVSIGFFSCSDEWLDAKPSKSIVDATSLEDFQAILDNNSTINKVLGLSELSADNYYLHSTTWNNSTTELQKNIYVWDDDIYGAGIQNGDWTNAYTRILLSNIVLEKIDTWESRNTASKESANLRGAALFLRSFNFYNLAQVFCMPYGVKEYDLYGLPLRLNSNVNERASRSTVSDTYSTIIDDLRNSCRLLPIITPYKTRPNKVAGYGLLSRVYHSMQDYANSLLYADSCIRLAEGLIDYTTIDNGLRYPIPKLNKEILFYAELEIFTFNYGTAYNVDSILFSQYAEADHRKSLFFQETTDGVKYRGSYTGAATLFGGISLDEIYLNKMESQLRTGDVQGARESLEYFLSCRTADVSTNLAELDTKDLLSYILVERRKQLLFRGLRWTDIKRINRDNNLEKIHLKRVLFNQNFELEPNSSKYMIPIPPNELVANDIVQNPR